MMLHKRPPPPPPILSLSHPVNPFYLPASPISPCLSSQSCSSWWSTTCTGSRREPGTSAPRRAACQTGPAPTPCPPGRSSPTTTTPLRRPLRSCAAKWRVCLKTVSKKLSFACLKRYGRLTHHFETLPQRKSCSPTVCMQLVKCLFNSICPLLSS